MALKEFGLSEKEAKVYLTLLREGSCTITPLIKKTQFQKGSLYDLLERLMEKGVVSYVIKSNRKNFEAVDPKKLLMILEAKKDRLEEVLPSLLQKQPKEETKITIYKGRKGLRSVYLDLLSASKDTFVLGARGDLANALGEIFYHKFQKKREKTTDYVKLIFNESARGMKHIKEIPRSESRFVSSEYDVPSHTTIYGNKVIIHILEEIPYAILIESESVAKSYTNFFNMLWKIAKS